MNDFFEAIAFVLIGAAVLALFFIFDGTPDLWDKWHEKAMSAASCQVSPTK